MKISGIQINDKALAAGLYDMFSEQELTLLSFGMLPADKMGSFEVELGTKFKALVEHQMGITLAEVEDHEQEIKEKFPALAGYLLSDEIAAQKKKFVSTVTHEVSVEIYAIHARKGKMVV